VQLARRSLVALCSSLAVAALLGGCSGDKAASPATGTTVVAGPLPDPQPTPRPHLADGVRDLLAAEQRGDRVASFLLLSRTSRAEFKDVADWTARRQSLPEITGFRIDDASEGDAGDRAGKVVVLVEHTPGLDPFKGLSLARERLTYTGSREGRGWLVDAEPASDPVLPPDNLAIEAATAWVGAVQACDKAKAASLQAVTTIFGTAEGASGLCGKTASVASGEVVRLTPGVGSADIVAQYSTDALDWSRVVRITSPATFGVVMAPLGERWQVLGLVD
jgi:hypothetical protein